MLISFGITMVLHFGGLILGLLVHNLVLVFFCCSACMKLLSFSSLLFVTSLQVWDLIILVDLKKTIITHVAFFFPSAFYGSLEPRPFKEGNRGKIEILFTSWLESVIVENDKLLFMINIFLILRFFGNINWIWRI